MIENKEELIYVMQFYSIGKVELTDGQKQLGHVTLTDGNLKYVRDGQWKYNKDLYAFNRAMEQLNADMERIKDWRNIAAKKFSTLLIYKGNSGESFEKKKSYLYNNDIRDSKVTATEDDEKRLVIEGTIDQLRKFLSYANNHLRYCNGCSYKYSDEELNKWMKLFYRYGLYEKYDSFDEYYHGGIVD